MGDYYYYLDATWDEGKDIFGYFLVGSERFLINHTPRAEYLTSEFSAKYPIDPENYIRPTDPVLFSGKCGENVNWSLSFNGVLTISGEGAMTTYTSTNDLPWTNNRSGIRELVVSEGITSLTHLVCYACTNLKTVTLPASLTSIGQMAFESCRSLTTVRYGGTREQWDNLSVNIDNDPLMNAELWCGVTRDPVTHTLTDPEGLYALYTSEAVQNGDTIEIKTTADVNEINGNDPWVMDKAVTIKGGKLTLRPGGILLGADVTFDGVTLVFANRVRNAIMANGHTLILEDVQYDTSANAVHLFCGGMTGSDVSADSGNHGKIIIRGNTSLGNIYAGSISSDGMENTFDMPATILVSSSAAGSMGTLFACGALETYVPDNEMLNPNYVVAPPTASAESFKVSGEVTIELQQRVVKTVDGTTGGETNAAVIYNGNGYACELTLTNLSSLSVESGNLIPVDSSMNGDVSVANGACLTLSGFGDTLTVGNFTGGGDIVLDEKQTLRITGDVSGVTRVGIGGIFEDKSQGTFANEHIYIVAPKSNDSSFVLLPFDFDPSAVFERDVDGNWTILATETEKIVIKSAAMEDEYRVGADEQLDSVTIPVTVSFSSNPEFSCLSEVPAVLSINGETAQMEHDEYGYYYSFGESSVFRTAFFTYVYDCDVLYIEGVDVIPTGRYVITVIIPAEYMADGYDLPLATFLIVGETEPEEPDSPIVIACGACGENLEWVLTSDGVLTISGEGEMYGYDIYGAPWDSERSAITEVIIGDSVTSIGAFVFYGCDSLTSVEIPNSVVSLGESAFAGCNNLNSVTIGNGVTSIDDNAFHGCNSLSTVNYTDTEQMWKMIKVGDGNEALKNAAITYLFGHEHSDSNLDHICDGNCGKTDIGAHADSATDADHVCDYGCGAVLEECSDKTEDGDHACDICGAVNVSEHSWVDATCAAPKTCSECGATEGEALEHIDENKDHKCDYDCGKTDIGAHADSTTDADHVCDYGCGVALEECSDAMGDKNHACDICGAVNVSGHSWDDATCAAPKTCSECGATEGEALEHIDENKDHKCDYDCGKTDIGAHADSATDEDHVCDYGCGVAVEECSDAMGDKNHACDICGAVNVSGHSWVDATCAAPKTCSECGATEGEALEHIDENKDHKCDYDCGKTDIGAHADSATDADHVCDYGCGVALEECSDAMGDKNHACDICGAANISGHSWDDATCKSPKTCSECGATEGEALEHIDENKDHKCDYDCGKTDIGAHADSATDADHVCDYGCGAVMEECSDAMGDKNHACDICGAVNISGHSWDDATCAAPKACSECGATEGEALEHIDENKDHKCDYDCGKTDIGTHADSDKNHACDYGCTTTIGEHTDSGTDADHVCDYGCGAVMEECSDAMGDKNHACDICGAANISGHSWDDATCKAPKTCSECGATEGEALEHIDENKDHKCDYDCGKTDIGAHADSATDADHVCDYGCGAVMEECSDKTEDGDHACDICGAVNVSGHSWDDATCKAPKTCSECGATEGEKLAHTEEIVPGKAATCTEDGLTDGKRCIVCGEVTVEQTVVPAPGHAEEIVPGTEATLTTPGLTKGKKCSVCDEILVEQKEIPTLEFITGKCGEDLAWTLTKDGVLTISGTGAMFNFKIIIDLLPLNAVPMSEVDLEAAPWIDYTALITKVVIEGGVTSIGDNAFATCENLTEVEISETVTEIGDDVFAGCEALEIVTYSGSQEQWDEIKIGEGNEMMDGKIEANANSVKKGDVNGDGNVNGRDTIIIATAIANRATQDFTPEQFKAADVNGDGSVNGRDTIIIATAIANRTTDEL